jgi:FAD/FMN-containing dehydrogenase
MALVLQRAFRESGASEVTVAVTTDAERHLWDFRHAASPALTRLDPALAAMQFIEDGAVPPDHLPEYVRGVREALARQGIRGVIFGHAGDAHVHVNPLIDTRVPGWRERVEALLDETVALTARLGGTLAGEHGDGRLRASLLERVWPAETVALFRDVKHAFDPRGILNPGVKVPLEGQQAIAAVKYDPLLPPLPAAARAALDRLVRDRDYSAFRLSLIPERN